MKRAVVFLILLSMMLHCSIRLGFFTWIYQNRLEIAFTLGLSDEKPITMCGHEYDVDRAVKIEVSQDNHDKLPINPFQVREINLFLSMTETIPGRSGELLLSVISNCTYQFSEYPDPGHSFFQPPRI